MTEQGPLDDGTKSEAELGREARDTIFPFDPQLLNLVMLINLMEETEIGVTLHVRGSVVSGMLISARRFFKYLVEGLDESTRQNDRPELGESFADFYRPTLEFFEAEHARYRDDNKFPDSPRHLHLRHAQTYVTGSEPLGPLLWRGRLASVDAWTIGNFGTIPHPPEWDSQLPRADQTLGDP